MSLCVVVTGTPLTGFRVVGPFKQFHYADEWADEWLDTLDWWVAPLESEQTLQEEIENGCSS